MRDESVFSRRVTETPVALHALLVCRLGSCLALTSSTARFSAPGVSVSRREKIPSSRKRLLAKNAQNLNTKSIIQTQARRRVLAKKREIAYSKKYPGSPVVNGVGAAANEEDLSLQNRSARIKYL